MTREEAIKILKEIIDEGWLISDFDKCIAIDACEMAIKALKQKFCEDAISRQEVLDKINQIGGKGFKTYNDYSELFDFVDTLLPVTPKQRTGHLVPRNSFLLQYKCSECGRDIEKYDFCPHCGAKMIEPQEGEDK